MRGMLARRIGLGVFAYLFILSGLKYAFTPPVSAATDYAERFITGIIDRQIWGWIWIVLGLFMVASIFARRLQPAAFSACAFMFSLWGVGYVVASIPLFWHHWFALGLTILSSSVLWLGFGALVFVLAIEEDKS